MHKVDFETTTSLLIAILIGEVPFELDPISTNVANGGIIFIYITMTLLENIKKESLGLD